MPSITSVEPIDRRFKQLPPGVWRASERSPAPLVVRSSGYDDLDLWLPGGGWPVGALVEILHDAPGCGELSLAIPALAALPLTRPIALLGPPGIPNITAWQQWQVAPEQLWWLHPKQLTDAWWCAETVLRSRTFGALLAWVDPVDPAALRRLHACAQDSQTLVFLFRPVQAAHLFSPSPLRLQIAPTSSHQVAVQILKAKGPKPAEALLLTSDHHRISPLHSLFGMPHVDGHSTLAVAR